MKRLLGTALSLTMALGATSAFAGCDAGETVIKFSHVTNTDKHPKGIAATLLAARVNEEMNGKACMEVFPNSTLYDDNKVLEALLNGDVHLAAPSLSKFEKFTKQFRIFDLPFMFQDIEAVDAFQASDAGQALLDSMQRRGLQGLTFWHNGMKQMSANVPLMSPTDAEGLKFRVMSSDVLVAQMKAIGGAPQKMAFSEVYGALQQGVVDVIGSDHAPHTLEEKARPYPESPSGMPGVQTLVPILLDHVNRGNLTLERFVDLTSTSVQRVFGIAGKGRMALGYDADLTLVDLKRTETITDAQMANKSGWTPFDGKQVTGWPVMTMVRGITAMRDGAVQGRDHGRPVRFQECL